MTLCLKRWKIHVRMYGWRISVHRGGICMCDLNAILKEIDKRWWVRWWVKLTAFFLLLLIISGCAAIKARQDAQWNKDYSWINWPTNQ